jgi:hypothetical protein
LWALIRRHRGREYRTTRGDRWSDRAGRNPLNDRFAERIIAE